MKSVVLDISKSINKMIGEYADRYKATSEENETERRAIREAIWALGRVAGEVEQYLDDDEFFDLDEALREIDC